MPLPILKTSSDATPEALVRYYHQTELQWTRHVGEETQLEVGTAFTNSELPNVHYANRILDAAVPDGVTPAQAVAQVDEHYRQANTRCWGWVMNPSAPPDRTQP